MFNGDRKNLNILRRNIYIYSHELFLEKILNSLKIDQISAEFFSSSQAPKNHVLYANNHHISSLLSFIFSLTNYFQRSNKADLNLEWLQQQQHQNEIKDEEYLIDTDTYKNEYNKFKKKNFKPIHPEGYRRKPEIKDPIYKRNSPNPNHNYCKYLVWEFSS